MAPYYEQDGITIYHADCRDVLGTLAPRSVALILTDPPYGIDKADWDHDVWSLLSDVAGRCSEILHPEGLCFWFCSIRYLVETLRATESIPYRWQFIWYAPNNMQHGDLGFVKYTPALVLAHGKAWRNMQDFRAVPIPPKPLSADSHPTVKPLELFSYIVEMATRPGDLIVDPFMGTGTALVAAKRAGRRAIGIDNDRRWCEIAARRLQQAVLPLDIPPASIARQPALLEAE